MKLCDKCGCRNEKHSEVGPVKVAVTGYHYNHWTHNEKVSAYNEIDLCPKCTAVLKETINNVVKSFRVS